MIFFDSDKNDAELFAKLVIGIFGSAWLVMLAAGTLAHHHPQLLHVLWQFSYWDWILINLVASIVRGKSASKWYFKTSKEEKK